MSKLIFSKEDHDVPYSVLYELYNLKCTSWQCIGNISINYYFKKTHVDFFSGYEIYMQYLQIHVFYK